MLTFFGANLNFSVLGCFPVLEHRYEQCSRCIVLQLFKLNLRSTNVKGAKHFKTVDWTGTKMTNIVLDDGIVINSDHDW